MLSIGFVDYNTKTQYNMHTIHNSGKFKLMSIVTKAEANVFMVFQKRNCIRVFEPFKTSSIHKTTSNVIPLKKYEKSNRNFTVAKGNNPKWTNRKIYFNKEYSKIRSTFTIYQLGQWYFYNILSNLWPRILNVSLQTKVKV